MNNELLSLFGIIGVIWSGIFMIAYSQSKKNEKSLFFNPIEIIDYIQITRKENGKIGAWFWIFVLSLILFMFSIG